MADPSRIADVAFDLFSKTETILIMATGRLIGWIMGNRFDLIADMKSFVNARGGKYEEWYVGACTDPRTTLFDTHKVRKNSDAWIYLVADSAIAATHFPHPPRQLFKQFPQSLALTLELE